MRGYSRYSKNDATLGLGAILAVIVITLVICYYSDKANKNNINEMITSKGGTVTSIDSRVMSIGPFYLKGKGQSVYKIEYKDKNGNKQEAWMRTGWSDDWVWDYKEEK